MSKLLFDSHPLVILPELAVKIGLNESIIIQQLHYWLEINKKANRNLKDGYYWTFNSYTDWKKQFPFFSDSTIRRTITKLEKGMLVVSGNYNKLSIDRTKWYRIDEEVLKKLEDYPCGQNEQVNWSDWTNHVVSMTPPLPKTNSETNSETNLYISLPTDDHIFLRIYGRCFYDKFGKDHMKISPEQLSGVIDKISTLTEYDVTSSAFRDEVVEHFNTLPKSNNGNIIAFLMTCKRRFDVDTIDYNVAK